MGLGGVGILINFQTFTKDDKEKNTKQKLLISGMLTANVKMMIRSHHAMSNFRIINVKTYIKDTFLQKTQFMKWICISGYITATIHLI